jgi:hypothetical protein
VGKAGQQDKPFTIPKRLVQEAYRRVKANKGAAGVDRVSMEGFEEDLRGNLYKIWNRMSSGTYFPPPVKAVEIPKSHGGTRILGVPTVGDRIAQTVVALQLEARTESIFHSDSYGYRPGKSAHDALAKCRQRCWEGNWVVDLDIEKFFDSLDHDLVVKTVEANTDQKWVLLYVKRWLKAPLQMPDGTLRERGRGTNGLALSDHVRAEQVELDFPDDLDDARLTGLAGREVAGFLGLAGAGPVRAVAGEGARGEDLEQERGEREIGLLRGKKPRRYPSRRPGHAGS